MLDGKVQHENVNGHENPASTNASSRRQNETNNGAAKAEVIQGLEGKERWKGRCRFVHE